MSRILPKALNQEFLDTYGGADFANECSPDKLVIKLWDVYGTAPEDHDAVNTASGTYLAAMAICDECSKGRQFNREELLK